MSPLPSLRALMNWGPAHPSYPVQLMEIDGLFGDWIYCPDCGSCGIGGCCHRYCPTCRDRHDEADEIEDAQGVGEGAL